jgi:hypothetical protein
MSEERTKFETLRARYTGPLRVWVALPFEKLRDEIRDSALKFEIDRYIEEQSAARKKRLAAYTARLEQQKRVHANSVLNLARGWAIGEIDRSVAVGVVKASAWWLTHSSGKPVRAPGHAYRLDQHQWGWSVEFGANHFLVGRAVQRSALIIRDVVALSLEGKTNLSQELDKITSVLPTCVANFQMVEYDYYPSERGRLVFGAQAIDIKDFGRFLLQTAGINRSLLGMT